jgi:hypothetical protein
LEFETNIESERYQNSSELESDRTIQNLNQPRSEDRCSEARYVSRFDSIKRQILISFDKPTALIEVFTGVTDSQLPSEGFWEECQETSGYQTYQNGPEN